METVCSLSHDRGPRGRVVFDFVVGYRGAGWWRHDFDGEGRYKAVGPARLEDVRDGLASLEPVSYVLELRSAARALEAMVGGLLDGAEGAALAGEGDASDQLADQAGRIEHERLRILDEVARTCDSAWHHAVQSVERARGHDPDALPGAIRTVEQLWTARQAVRHRFGPRRPG
jgi:hypothetical protein